jgi:hypothetical protein
MAWKVEYNNDVGPNDEGFWEWYEVTDGNRTFKSNSGEDANWLCDELNKLRATDTGTR